uniref:Uncharacterized protein n=1 Tax=Myotis myotis TaxID=51298 RepID=A0A7J7SSI8_MYOMY|nr:hypothetical protein mMyoMyo1_009417 [Myotis myotis]
MNYNANFSSSFLQFIMIQCFNPTVRPPTPWELIGGWSQRGISCHLLRPQQGFYTCMPLLGLASLLGPTPPVFKAKSPSSRLKPHHILHQPRLHPLSWQINGSFSCVPTGLGSFLPRGSDKLFAISWIDSFSALF